MLALVAVCGAVSLVLWTRLVRGDFGKAETFFGTLLLLVPVFGPLLYLFFIDPPPPQPTNLQNRGPRGAYADQWAARGPVMAEVLERVRARRRGRQAGEDAATRTASSGKALPTDRDAAP